MTPKRLSRRQFLTRTGLGGAGLILAPSILAACSNGDDTGSSSSGSGSASVAAEPQDVKFRLNWVPAVDFGGWYVADSKGYFTDAGINIDIAPGGPNTPEPVQVLAGGAAQVALVTDLLTVSDANKQGSDLVLWGAKLQQSPLGLLSLASNPIRTAEEMVGRTLGGPEGDQTFIDAVLTLNGLQAGDYTFVPTGFDPAPVVNGKVEAMTCYVTNQPIALDLQNIDNVAVTFADMGMPSYADMLCADRTYLQDNHDLMVNFMKASIQGWDFSNASDANLKEMTHLTLDEYGGADAGQEFQQQYLAAQAQVPLMQSDVGTFWIDMDQLAGPMYAALKATGRENLPDPETIVDMSILEEVYPQSS